MYVYRFKVRMGRILDVTENCALYVLSYHHTSSSTTAMASNLTNSHK